MEEKEETMVLKSLRQLVGEARELNPRFREKYDYWAQRRRIDTDWLFSQLETILGRARIRAELDRVI